MHLHNPTDNHPPTSLPLPLSHMAKPSRDPFSPLVPMKKKKKVKKAVVVPAVVVPAALGTQKKKKTTTASAKQNLELLSNLDEESIFPRKALTEDMPSYVPYGNQNTSRSTRAVFRQPPALLYLPLLPPIADDDCNPLNHNSPHKDPPAEFVEEAASGADLSDAMEDEGGTHFRRQVSRPSRGEEIWSR